METNAVVDSGSRSELRLPVKFAGVLEDKRATMTGNVGSSTSGVASAEARRKRMPVVKRDGGLLKRRRTKIDRDSGFVPPPLSPYIINQGRMVFLFYKKLQNSDVNNVGRTILPKRSAETHLPSLLDNQSIILPMFDMDGPGAWTFKFRYWPNNHSRMYVFEGTGPFIQKYKLQTGDYMLIYRDMVNWNYLIRAVKASEDETCANKEMAAVEGTNTANVVPNDADFGDVNLPDNPAYFAEIESFMDTGFMNDNSYFSNILNSLSSWDEIEKYYLPPTQPSVSFDNMSSEDLSRV
ncbi:hypothetical protein R6Q57_026737 [Mikania cordata]